MTKMISKTTKGSSVTAVIDPLDRLKLEVLVRDEILTRGENSSLSAMISELLHSLLDLPLMQKKVLACAERQAAQDAQRGNSAPLSAANRVLAAYRGVPPVPTTAPELSQSTQPAQPEPEPAELVEQPVFDLASLNPGLRVASVVRPAGYAVPPSKPVPAVLEAEPEYGDSRRARGLIG